MEKGIELVDTSLESSIYVQEIGYFFFMMAHLYLAYYFFHTTSMYYHLYETLEELLRSERRHKYIFIGMAMAIFLLGLGKSLAIEFSDSEGMRAWDSILISLV